MRVTSGPTATTSATVSCPTPNGPGNRPMAAIGRSRSHRATASGATSAPAGSASTGSGTSRHRTTPACSYVSCRTRANAIVDPGAPVDGSAGPGWGMLSRWEQTRLTGSRASGWASPSSAPGSGRPWRPWSSGRDVLAVLPTGAGKSAIYELAGLLRDGPDRRRLAAHRARGRSARPPAVGRAARDRAELAAVGRQAVGGAAGRVRARHVRVPVARAAGQRGDPVDAAAGRRPACSWSTRRI